MHEGSRHVVLLDAGAYFFGNGLAFAAFSGDASRSIFSSLDYDAYSLAYHDFAAGPVARGARPVPLWGAVRP